MCLSFRHHRHAAKARGAGSVALAVKRCGWLIQGLHEGATDRRTALLSAVAIAEAKSLDKGLAAGRWRTKWWSCVFMAGL